MTNGEHKKPVESLSEDLVTTQWFRVEVTDRWGKVVAIEPGHLAGREIGAVEEAAIRKAIAHLDGFIGPVKS